MSLQKATKAKAATANCLIMFDSLFNKK